MRIMIIIHVSLSTIRGIFPTKVILTVRIPLPNRDFDSVEAPRSSAATQLRKSVGAANIMNHMRRKGQGT